MKVKKVDFEIKQKTAEVDNVTPKYEEYKIVFDTNSQKLEILKDAKTLLKRDIFIKRQESKVYKNNLALDAINEKKNEIRISSRAYVNFKDRKVNQEMEQMVLLVLIMKMCILSSKLRSILALKGLKTNRFLKV